MAERQGIRLDSWKAIAEYLGRSLRTVQRWHALYALPVHRMGGTSGGVFAYTEEIDEWFRHDGQRIEPGLRKGSKGLLIEMRPKKSEDEPTVAGASESVNARDKARARSRTDTGYAMWRLLSRNNLHTIAHTFREAIDLDPQNAQAYAGLSHALIAQAIIGSLSRSSAYSSARVAIDSALKLDPSCSEAICAMAWLKMASERDWEGAEKLFDHLLEDDSVSTWAMVGRALLQVAQGDLGPASDLLYAASERDALSSLPLGLHSWSEYLAGKYSEVMDHLTEARESARIGTILTAAEALTSIQYEKPSESGARIEELLAEEPRNEVVRGALGYVAGRSGDKRTALSILEYLNRRHSHAKDSPHYAIALTYLGLGAKEQVIQSIVQSYESGSLWSLGFHVDPVLRSLEEETEFKDFIRKAYPVARAETRSAANRPIPNQRLVKAP